MKKHLFTLLLTLTLCWTTTAATTLPDICIAGRYAAAVQSDGAYLCAMPQPADALTITCPEQATNTYLLRDENGQLVSSSATLQTRQTYSLYRITGGSEERVASVWFTTMPVLELSHEGTLSKNMDYVWGHMRLSSDEAQTTCLQLRLKTRGATAMSYLSKPALTLKLRQRQQDGSEIETDTTLLSMRRASSWILDAMAIDRIEMRNRVSWDIWNEFSHLPYNTEFGSRNGTVGRFVEVIINGAYKGIYCITDRINRSLLELKKPELDAAGHLLNVRGALYKHGTNDVADQNTPGYFNNYTAYVVAWHDAYELSEPDEEYACQQAWDALNDLYAHTHDVAWIKSRFFLPQLAEYKIFIIGLSIADNWGLKNSYLSIRNMYADGDKKRFIYTPWDLDTSLGGYYDGKYYDGTYSDWKVTDAMKMSGPEPYAILSADSEFQTESRNAWIRASRAAMSVSSVQQKMEAYRDLFLTSGAWERQVAHRNGAKLCNDLTQEVNYIVDWYRNRFAQMDAYFHVTDTDRNNYTALPLTQAATTTSAHIEIIDGKVYIRQGDDLYTITGQRAK